MSFNTLRRVPSSVVEKAKWRGAVSEILARSSLPRREIDVTARLRPGAMLILVVGRFHAPEIYDSSSCTQFASEQQDRKDLRVRRKRKIPFEILFVYATILCSVPGVHFQSCKLSICETIFFDNISEQSTTNQI